MRDELRQEQVAQLSGLRKFARDLAIPEDMAVAVYEREVLRLREGAHVERFVGILAEKRAKHVLKTHGR